MSLKAVVVLVTFCISREIASGIPVEIHTVDGAFSNVLVEFERAVESA